MGIGKFLGSGVADFGENERSQTGGLGGGRGGVFGENSGIMGDAGAGRCW